MNPNEVYATLTQNKQFLKLTARQKAVVLMVINPDFRDAIITNRRQEIVELTPADITELQGIPKGTLDDVTEQYRAGLNLAESQPGAVTVKALPAFVAGMAVGYAAYAYAAKY